MFIEVLYLTMFLFLRGILGTCIVYYVVFKSDVFTAEHKIITLLLYIVSIAFMYDILGYTLYKYKKEIVSKNELLTYLLKIPIFVPAYVYVCTWLGTHSRITVCP